jgi:hypothetical protein
MAPAPAALPASLPALPLPPPGAVQERSSAGGGSGCCASGCCCCEAGAADGWRWRCSRTALYADTLYCQATARVTPSGAPTAAAALPGSSGLPSRQAA